MVAVFEMRQSLRDGLRHGKLVGIKSDFPYCVFATIGTGETRRKCSRVG